MSVENFEIHCSLFLALKEHGQKLWATCFAPVMYVVVWLFSTLGWLRNMFTFIQNWIISSGWYITLLTNHPHLDDLCESQIIHIWNPTLPAWGRLSSLILKNNIFFLKCINRFSFHGLAWPLTPHTSSQSALRYRLATPRQTSLVMEPLLDYQETDYKKVDQPSPGASLMINVLI